MTQPRRLFLLLPALLAPACAGAETLPGPRWTIAAIDGQPAARPADITFSAEGRASGATGCNRFTGGYTLDGPSLRFGAVAGTRMACLPDAMEQEQRIHRAFDAVRGWRQDGSAMLLTGEDGTVLLRLEPPG